MFICYYARRYIITTNIYMIHEKCLLSLYETIKRNICCHYKDSCIMTTNISLIHESVFLII